MVIEELLLLIMTSVVRNTALCVKIKVLENFVLNLLIVNAVANISH